MTRPAPKLLVAVAGLVIAVLGILLFVGGQVIGVTTDEPYHVQRLNNFLASGWYVVDFQADAEGNPLPGVTDQYVYGPATSDLLHVLNQRLGIDGDTASTASRAYFSRHVGVGILSLLAPAAVGVIARLVTGSKGWGVVGAAVLLALPMWTGHSMFNVKDPSVAAGYTLATLGLVATIRHGTPLVRWRVAIVFTIAAGTWLAMGTRPGMWVGIVGSWIVTVVLIAQSSESVRRKADALLDTVVGLLIGYGALLWTYPNVFGTPLEMLYQSATGSAGFLSLEASPWFVPVRVFFLMPAVILAFVLVGIVVIGGRVIRARLRPPVQTSRAVVVAVQMLALPLATVVHPSALYSDLRQVLFAAPAAAVFATISMSVLWTAASREGTRAGRAMVRAATCLGLILPTASQLVAFPYNYVAYNPLVEVAGLQGVTPSEYYKASVKELIPDISTTSASRVVCNALTDDQGNVIPVAKLDGTGDCRALSTSPISPLLPDSEQSPRQWDGLDFFAVVQRRPDPPNCQPVVTIRVRVLWSSTPFWTLMDCVRVVPTLSTDRVEVTESTGAEPVLPYLDDGWYVTGRTWGPATLSFRVPSSDPNRRAAMALEGPGTPDVTVAVDGVAVDERWDRGVLSFELPASAEAGGVVRVTLSGPTGENPDVTIVGLWLEGSSL